MRWLKSKDIPKKKHRTEVSQHPLVNEFRRAAFGSSCRTRAMKSELGEIWLKAVAPISTDKWTIMRMTRSDYILPIGSDKAVNTPAWKTKVEASDLSFFDAIEHLAVFENSQPDFPYEPTGLSKKDMKLEHYEAFGLREGLAFDAEDGMPHPTAYGEIVTKGTFTDKMLNKVKAAGEKKKKFLSEDSNLITSLLGTAPSANEFEDFIDTVSVMPHFKKLISRIKEARLCYELALECNYDWRRFNTRKFEQSSVGWQIKDHDALFEEVLYKADEEALSPIKKSKSVIDTGEIEKFFQRFQLAYYLSWAKTLAQRAASSEEHALLEDVIDYTKKCEKQYRDLGASEEEIEQIKGYIVNGRDVKIPHEIDLFIQELDDKYTKIRENLVSKTGAPQPKP